MKNKSLAPERKGSWRWLWCNHPYSRDMREVGHSRDATLAVASLAIVDARSVTGGDRDLRRWGGGGMRLYLMIHCRHQNDSGLRFTAT